MIDRTAYELDFDEDFSGAELDPRRWVAHYLPQWTTPDRSAARYELEPGVLRLRIYADQPAGVADGELRVSNLQTGTFSGPPDSAVGQHRHRDDLVVESAQAERRLYTPSEGLVDAVLRASPDPTCMLAFWLVGFESSPEQSGEICVAELFGNAVGPRRSGVRDRREGPPRPAPARGHGGAVAGARRERLARLCRRVGRRRRPLLRRRPSSSAPSSSGSTIRCS